MCKSASERMISTIAICKHSVVTETVGGATPPTVYCVSDVISLRFLIGWEAWSPQYGRALTWIIYLYTSPFESVSAPLSSSLDRREKTVFIQCLPLACGYTKVDILNLLVNLLHQSFV